MAKTKQPPLKVAVVDVLKPHKPDIVEFGKSLCKERSVTSVNITVYAIDEKTESVKIIMSGKNIKFNKIRSIIEDYGAVVHSVDKVVFGEKETLSIPTEIQ